MNLRAYIFRYIESLFVAPRATNEAVQLVRYKRVMYVIQLFMSVTDILAKMFRGLPMENSNSICTAGKSTCTLSLAIEQYSSKSQFDHLLQDQQNYEYDIIIFYIYYQRPASICLSKCWVVGLNRPTQINCFIMYFYG